MRRDSFNTSTNTTFLTYRNSFCSLLSNLYICNFFPMFTETLRKYPIVPFLDRMCCSDYKLPAPNGNETVTLPAHTGVYITVLAIHHDPTYFPEPQKFDPDRFTEENKRSRPTYSYIPFGQGPRMCLGKDRHLRVPCTSFRFQSYCELRYNFSDLKPCTLRETYSFCF
jgi:hypothetical protein